MRKKIVQWAQELRKKANNNAQKIWGAGWQFATEGAELAERKKKLEAIVTIIDKAESQATDGSKMAIKQILAAQEKININSPEMDKFVRIWEEKELRRIWKEEEIELINKRQTAEWIKDIYYEEMINIRTPKDQESFIQKKIDTDRKAVETKIEQEKQKAIERIRIATEKAEAISAEKVAEELIEMAQKHNASVTKWEEIGRREKEEKVKEEVAIKKSNSYKNASWFAAGGSLVGASAAASLFFKRRWLLKEMIEITGDPHVGRALLPLKGKSDETACKLISYHYKLSAEKASDVWNKYKTYITLYTLFRIAGAAALASAAGSAITTLIANKAAPTTATN